MTNTTALPCSASLFAATRFPNWLLAGAAKGGAHPSEFALQHTREVRDDQNERTDDKAKKDDILRHRGTLFVPTQLIEELANLIHNSAPYSRRLLIRRFYRRHNPPAHAPISGPRLEPDILALIIRGLVLQVNTGIFNSRVRRVVEMILRVSKRSLEIAPASHGACRSSAMRLAVRQNWGQFQLRRNYAGHNRLVAP